MRIYVAGYDARMDYAAKSLQDAGFEVTSAPCAQECGALVLSVRCSDADRKHVQQAQQRGAYVIGGMLPVHGERCFDYMKDEAFLYENARITAEGAIMLLGAELAGTLYGADIAIVGMGRIAECMCRMLCALGVRTTVYARRPEALARARALGAATICFTGTLKDLIARHDAVCNTVPHVLLHEGLLSELGQDVLLLELASAPGGFDMAAVERYGLHYVNGQGLPGKYAPRAAGELIANYTVKVLKGEIGHE